MCVKKDSLSVAVRSSKENLHGDIFTLVMDIKKISFGKANKYLHDILGLKYVYGKNNKDDNKKDPLAIFKKIKRRKYTIDKEIPVYDDSILKEYVDLPYIGWIREGVLPFACKRFNIGYSYDKKRIVIPERKWDGDDNEYIGISGRTTVPNYEMFDIPKFFKLSKTYPKGMNVYGLNENYQTIQEAGYVVVFEAQKSVLKRYSRKDGTTTAIGNCEFTEEQVRILISLGVEIIVAFDEGIDINHVRQECDKFYPIRKISYMFDKWGLLKSGSKDSPADEPNNVYNFMLKHRVIYDESERRKLRTWREKQNKN